MKIEVSFGEIVDKLSILQLKRNNITESEKLKNVIAEYDYLRNIVFNNLNIQESDFLELLQINEILWNIEDKLREMESRKQFDDLFVEYARQVYITNDKRAEIKKQINLKYGSKFREEKSYKQY
jgi:hypothetical protein